VQPAERRKQECQIDFVSIVRTDTCTRTVAAPWLVERWVEEQLFIMTATGTCMSMKTESAYSE